MRTQLTDNKGPPYDENHNACWVTKDVWCTRKAGDETREPDSHLAQQLARVGR